MHGIGVRSLTGRLRHYGCVCGYRRKEDSDRARQLLRSLYRVLYLNETAKLCGKVGADVKAVATGMGTAA